MKRNSSSRLSTHLKTFFVLVVILLLLSTSLIPISASGEQTQTFQNITVDEAYKMIKNENKYPNLIILDVRYQYEYDAGHLDDAILIPYDELETRISELQEHKDHEIIVYCKTGGRSQIASEILSVNDFTEVYNMLGGILSWIDAGYQLWTTSHFVTVNDVVNEQVRVQIEPLLSYQTSCLSCDDEQGCPSASITYTVQEHDDDHIVIFIAYEINDIILEYTIVVTLLWLYTELTNEINRSAYFTSTEITTEDTYWQFYTLGYLAQHEEYNLTLLTKLTPLTSEIYNTSFTNMRYIPTSENSPTSLEFVKFNLSVTLSEQYAILGEIAEKIGEDYEKSAGDFGDEGLAQLAQNYNIMHKEAKSLSKLVKNQIPEYNLLILQSSAILTDAVDPFCLTVCFFACILGCGGGTTLICTAVCLSLCAGCAGFWGCLPCIACLFSCGAMATAICYVIAQYGCSPGCEWLCSQI